MITAMRRAGCGRLTYQVEIVPTELHLDNSVGKSDRLRFAVIRKKKSKVSQVTLWKDHCAKWKQPIIFKSTIFREKSGGCQNKIYKLSVQTDASRPKSVATFELDVAKYAGHISKNNVIELRPTKCADKKASLVLEVRVTFMADGGPGSESDCSDLSDMARSANRIIACPMSPVQEIGRSSSEEAEGRNPFSTALAGDVSSSNPFAKTAAPSNPFARQPSCQDLSGFQDELAEAEVKHTELLVEEERKERELMRHSTASIVLPDVDEINECNVSPVMDGGKEDSHEKRATARRKESEESNDPDLSFIIGLSPPQQQQLVVAVQQMVTEELGKRERESSVRSWRSQVSNVSSALELSSAQLSRSSAQSYKAQVAQPSQSAICKSDQNIENGNHVTESANKLEVFGTSEWMDWDTQDKEKLTSRLPSQEERKVAMELLRQVRVEVGSNDPLASMSISASAPASASASLLMDSPVRMVPLYRYKDMRKMRICATDQVGVAPVIPVSLKDDYDVGGVSVSSCTHSRSSDQSNQWNQDDNHPSDNSDNEDQLSLTSNMVASPPPLQQEENTQEQEEQEQEEQEQEEQEQEEEEEALALVMEANETDMQSLVSGYYDFAAKINDGKDSTLMGDERVVIGSMSMASGSDSGSDSGSECDCNGGASPYASYSHSTNGGGGGSKDLVVEETVREACRLAVAAREEQHAATVARMEEEFNLITQQQVQQALVAQAATARQHALVEVALETTAHCTQRHEEELKAAMLTERGAVLSAHGKVQEQWQEALEGLQMSLEESVPQSIYLCEKDKSTQSQSQLKALEELSIKTQKDHLDIVTSMQNNQAEMLTEKATEYMQDIEAVKQACQTKVTQNEEQVRDAEKKIIEKALQHGQDAEAANMAHDALMDETVANLERKVVEAEKALVAKDAQHVAATEVLREALRQEFESSIAQQAQETDVKQSAAEAEKKHQAEMLKEAEKALATEEEAATLAQKASEAKLANMEKKVAEAQAIAAEAVIAAEEMASQFDGSGHCASASAVQSTGSRERSGRSDNTVDRSSIGIMKQRHLLSASVVSPPTTQGQWSSEGWQPNASVTDTDAALLQQEVQSLRRSVEEKDSEIGEIREVSAMGKSLWAQANTQLTEEKHALEQDLVATKLQLAQLMAAADTAMTKISNKVGVGWGSGTHVVQPTRP